MRASAAKRLPGKEPMLYLASKSPRRRELLGRLGLPFGIIDLDIPEERAPGEPAEDYVRRVAREKAGAGLLQVMGNASAVILGSDTEVVLDDEVFGKPRDADDAAAMLRKLSGRTHQVISAVSLVSPARELQTVSVSEVSFAALTEAQIARYLDGEQWQGKAGAYAIQGFAETFITKLSGSYTGVMGLPIHETAVLLRQFGLEPMPAECMPVEGAAPVAMP
jgi:septum formation protein